MLRSRASKNGIVGLDVEPGYIAAVETSVNGDIAVARAAGMALEGDVVHDGEVADVPALTEALRDLFAEHHLDRRVRLGIANQGTVLRALELPPIADRKELANAVRFQAQDELPMSLDDAVLDFHSLGVAETPAGPRQRVVLVATRRELVQHLLDAARAAGLRPEGVDLAAFALIRALRRPAQDDGARVLYLDVGGLTNLAVAEGRVCVFTRVIGAGIEAMSSEIAARAAMPLVQARALLAQVGMPAHADGPPGVRPAPAAPGDTHPSGASDRGATPDADDSAAEGAATDTPVVLDLAGPASPDSSADSPDPDPAVEDAQLPRATAPPQPETAAPEPSQDRSAALAREVMAYGVRRIAQEVRNSLEFAASQTAQAGVGHVVLSGSAVDIPGFAEALSSALGMSVEPRVVREAHAGAFGDVAPTRLSVAAGLTTEEAPA